MKAYWRAASRRIEEREARDWLQPTSQRPAAMPRIAVLSAEFSGAEDTLIVSRPQFDTDFFAYAFERALGRTDDALATIARCEAWTISRAFACGAERAATDGWCGSPLCGPCAEVRAEEAARAARARWPEVVFTVDIPIGVAGKRTLPTPEEVVLARDAWARAAKASEAEVGRVDGLPRAIVTPDGVLLFVQPPIGLGDDRANDVARTLEAAAQAAGHSQTVVRAATRDEAARALADALTLEARRFRETVTFDRVSGETDVAGRWVEHARARHADLRRPTVIGSRESLPVPDARGVSLQPHVCPDHADGCEQAATIVRDTAGRVLLEAPPLAARPTRQAFTAIAGQAARFVAGSAKLRAVA